MRMTETANQHGNLSGFVRAMLYEFETDGADGDHVITRFLKLRSQSAQSRQFKVFDTHPDHRTMEPGQTYTWMLFVFAYDLAPGKHLPERPTRDWEAAPLNGATQARILDIHWWLPTSWAALVSPDSQRRSYVLLGTPLGWVVTSRYFLADGYRDRAKAGDVIVWDHARLDVVGVVGVPRIPLAPIPQRRRSIPDIPSASVEPAGSLHSPSIELQERLDQHVLWLDSQRQEGRQFGMRQGVDGLARNERNLDLRRLLLAGARLDEASMAQVHLDDADLTGTSLLHAYLGGGSLVGATLDRANLTRARSPRADMQRASARRIIANFADFSDTNMQGADLTDAQLRGADFDDADLTHAALVGADLTDANLENARLAGARLTGARLMGAFLEGATGIDVTTAEFAFIGDPDAPQRLDGDALRQWLQEAVVKKARVAVVGPDD